MPIRTVLPPLLAELVRANVADDAVTLLCATRTHRQATATEMADLIGPELVARYRVVDHDAQSDAHVQVGEVDGVPIWLQREYVEADLRVITGFVEPHFFAGFSGGPKAVCPGLAATETILEAHHPRRIADTGPPSSPGTATRYTTSCGPRWHSLHRTSPSTSPSTGRAGSRRSSRGRCRRLTMPPRARWRGRACARWQLPTTSLSRPTEAIRSIAICTRRSKAWRRRTGCAVTGDDRHGRRGGDGVPDEGAFARLLNAAETPADLVAATAGPELDRWQAQVLGRVPRPRHRPPAQ